MAEKSTQAVAHYALAPGSKELREAPLRSNEVWTRFHVDRD